MAWLALQRLSCLWPPVSDSMQFGILNIIWYGDTLVLSFRNVWYGEILVLGFISFFKHKSGVGFNSAWLAGKKI